MSRLRTRKQTARSRPLYPRASWIWQGSAAHYICGDRCAFHLATVIGPWIVSTVGEYRSISGLAKHGENAPHETIGVDRFYETMVFRIGPKCEAKDCTEHHIDSGKNLDFAPANDRAEAHANHERLCALWACRGPRWRKR